MSDGRWFVKKMGWNLGYCVKIIHWEFLKLFIHCSFDRFSYFGVEFSYFKYLLYLLAFVICEYHTFWDGIRKQMAREMGYILDGFG